MTRGIILALGLLCAIGGAFYYHSPAQVRKREVQQMLADYAATVASQDSTQILEYIGGRLAEDAEIRLEVAFFSVGNQRPAIEERFTKPEFLRFIDNILYSTEQYHSTPVLQSVTPETMAWNSTDTARGKNMMGGVAMPMRYDLHTRCQGQLATPEGSPVFRALDCRLQLRQKIDRDSPLP